MSSSLPIDPPSARRLTDVLPQVKGSISGRPDWFGAARSAVVIVADGLGRTNLTARAGHLRFLAERMTKRDAARTVFPATTAAALTSLFTGRMPGEHGIVGYRVRIPDTDIGSNQLTGWERDGLDPHTWQRAVPLLTQEVEEGRPCFVVSKAQYARTGFTEATVRGATFVAAESVTERLALAASLAHQHDGALVYVYIPELDQAGHAHGSEGDAWADAAEEIDAALRRWEQGLARDVGAVLTADHGMVDVPRHRHLLLGEGDPLLDGVELFAGEPRMLHLYAAASDVADVAARWTAAESSRSWVMTRDEAIAAGLFGPVDDAVAPRIGDVLVAARAGIAYYDDRVADKKPQLMVGQHGSLTNQERVVPLIRLGAFS